MTCCRETTTHVSPQVHTWWRGQRSTCEYFHENCWVVCVAGAAHFSWLTEQRVMIVSSSLSHSSLLSRTRKLAVDWFIRHSSWFILSPVVFEGVIDHQRQRNLFQSLWFSLTLDSVICTKSKEDDTMLCSITKGREKRRQLFRNEETRMHVWWLSFNPMSWTDKTSWLEMHKMKARS